MLANRIQQRLQFSLNDFRRQATIEATLGYLRQQLEGAGVYTLLLGNLGSHHTNIPIETFRGFAIADPIAPFVVINDRDAKPVWAFTALHEVTHLWLGLSGVSGESLEAAVESTATTSPLKYCCLHASFRLLPTCVEKR